tara:strand:+ start:2692 stop:5088 length:2397 start_codon:yes stop_codon:yes gene_type:complete
MNEYNFKKIEKKWQEKWNDHSFMEKGYSKRGKKYYSLTMFSYPSGSNLHIGHWYNYGPADTFSRFIRMLGYDVFQPQGFDAFGLPAENFAIKHNIHPAKSTQNNIDTMRSQLDRIGALYDWDKTVTTSQKDYYRWTQWLFLELYKNNLAYRKKATVNWDPIDQTVLANEQVLADGTSERSGALVEQKPLEQWFFKITNYADELLSFDQIDWPKKTIRMQEHWIGKSVGATLKFQVDKFDENIEVFTTRPDTLFGATYLVLAPEHPLVDKITTDSQKDDILSYVNEISKKNDLQRTDLNKDKSGIFTGSYAINPINGKKIPIWIGDYVLVGYGSGAIMAVPGHDERDYEFAKKYNLKIVQVVDGPDVNIEKESYGKDGTVINSDFLNGLSTKEAKTKIIEHLEKKNIGKSKIQFKLKDWLISRQRYWGTPIPIVYDPDGNPHPIPDEYLPWELPDDVEFKPKGTSPLGTSKELIERTEKIFGKGWKPEIDTMDTFVCSSWYYLRYPDNKNTNSPFDKEIINDILPVDIYIGGAEHATMHLLYARFVTKALRDLGYLDFDEPFKKLYHQGTITKDGSKMSKSKGNTVSPDQFIEEYGSDTFRCYLMFMGPFDEGGDWNDKGIKGIYRFLNKLINICNKPNSDKSELKFQKIIHKTTKDVTADLKKIKFNTAISKIMSCLNELASADSLSIEDKHILVKLIAPFAPHLAEELWQELNNENISIFNHLWPEYDENLALDDNITIAIQVNGKLRGNIEVEKDKDKDSILELSKQNKNVSKFLDGKSIIKEIYIPSKLVNIVVK